MSERAYGHRLTGGARHKFSSGVIHSRVAVPGAICGKTSSSAEHREHSIDANLGRSLISRSRSRGLFYPIAPVVRSAVRAGLKRLRLADTRRWRLYSASRTCSANWLEPILIRGEGVKRFSAKAGLKGSLIWIS